MKKSMKIVSLAMTFVVTAAGAALATPSTQVWIPSTDIQAKGTWHLGIDNYFAPHDAGVTSHAARRRHTGGRNAWIWTKDKKRADRLGGGPPIR